MAVWLALSRAIDKVNEVIGRVMAWLVLVAVIVSASNAVIRKLFNMSSNAWLELQWYLFAAVVLLGASYTLQKNEHVRVDLIYGAISDRARLWLDLFGLIVFLLPVAFFCAWLCWPVFYLSWQQGEMSSNSGGLIRWPVKFVLAAGFFMLGLQGISEIIKRIAALNGLIALETKYTKPLQ